MSEHTETLVVEFVPNPAAAGRLVTDTELLEKAMQRMKIIADENNRLRKAITAVSQASENGFNEALANAVEMAAEPVPYTLTDFLPALRNAHC